MKRMIALLFVVLGIITVILGCSSQNAEERHSDDYYEGYDEGYSQGYFDGIDAAKQQVEELVIDDLYDLCHQIEDEWGIDPEEAARLLSNYADVPDEVDESDVPNAIWAIYSYFHDSWDIVYRIDFYDVE